MIDITEYIGLSQPAAMFGSFLPEHFENYSNLYVLTADMATNACLEKVKHYFPNRYANVGIAEQNLVGLSAGLASEGFVPIAIAQASFISMRAYEMNRQYLGYMGNNVKLIGLNSGFLLQFMGNTHYCNEDLSVMRTIPNMTVLSPADSTEAVLALDKAINLEGPVYIRLTGNPSLPAVHHSNYDYVIGKNITLKEGSDVVLFATGSMVGYAMETSALLASAGYSAAVIDVHTIKPFDMDSLSKYYKFKLIVSIEEHSTIGGLGSTIAEKLSERCNMPPLLKLGINDTFSTPGDYSFLLKQHRLTPELMTEDIINKIKEI